MSRKKILFIGGSLNQTTIMHQISQHLDSEYDCYFTPYYADPFIQKLANRGWADFSTLGGNFRVQTDRYFVENGLAVDFAGLQNEYDLVLTASDLLVPKNAQKTRLLLVQEGMTDPEGIAYWLVKRLGFPRFLASTATNGLSDAYGYFCVASEGYRDLFIRKGVKPEKMIVTGIPNFDNVAQYLVNDFPYRNYVLVATSDARETFKRDNRQQFIRHVLEVADGRQIIFKLHPNENYKRAKREIMSLAPQAMIMTEGDINPMIANCDVLMTQYSTCVYVGIGLGKEVHSYFDVEELKRLMPIQNGGMSSQNVAEVCRRWLEGNPVAPGESFYAHA